MVICMEGYSEIKSYMYNVIRLCRTLTFSLLTVKSICGYNNIIGVHICTFINRVQSRSGVRRTFGVSRHNRCHRWKQYRPGLKYVQYNVMINK